MKVLLSIKQGVKSRGKRYKDLSFDLNMSYNTVNRILNGFDPTPLGFDNKVDTIFKKWDSENKVSKN